MASTVGRAYAELAQLVEHSQLLAGVHEGVVHGGIRGTDEVLAVGGCLQVQFLHAQRGVRARQLDHEAWAAHTCCTVSHSYVAAVMQPYTAANNVSSSSSVRTLSSAVTRR